MRYYVVSDIHGYYTQMKSALDEAGFFSDTAPHKLVMLGDIFDRGSEAKQLQQFVLDHMEQKDIILIRGNHEDLFISLVTTDAGMPYGHHKSNGTYDTALQVTGFDPVMASIRRYDFADAAQTSDESKTIICGHWHASYGHSKYEKIGSEFGPDAVFSPYYGPGVIAIDACTAHSGMVNCIVLED